MEAAVRGDCESMDRTCRRAVRRTRVHAGSRLRLIGQWRRAGGMAPGARTHPETGVVPGGVRSPILATIFLHQVLEAWCEREGQPRLQGRSFRTRCADDVVIGCAREADAQKIMGVLAKRCARVGLRMHPTQTTLVVCRQPTASQAAAHGHGTGALRGFTHDWARTRRGFGVSTRSTARTRLRRTQQAWWPWCRHNRHAPLPYQYRMLCAQRRGHFRDDGIRGHFPLLANVRRPAEQAWRYGWSRRSSKKALDWEKVQKLLALDIVPLPQIVHNICAVCRAAQ